MSHCTGECRTCQAIQCRGTCKGAIEGLFFPAGALQVRETRTLPRSRDALFFWSPCAVFFLSARKKSDFGVCIQLSDPSTNGKFRLFDGRLVAARSPYERARAGSRRTGQRIACLSFVQKLPTLFFCRQSVAGAAGLIEAIVHSFVANLLAIKADQGWRYAGPRSLMNSWGRSMLTWRSTMRSNSASGSDAMRETQARGLARRPRTCSVAIVTRRIRVRTDSGLSTCWQI